MGIAGRVRGILLTAVSPSWKFPGREHGTFREIENLLTLP
jgi:hypothetical protein